MRTASGQTRSESRLTCRRGPSGGRALRSPDAHSTTGHVSSPRLLATQRPQALVRALPDQRFEPQPHSVRIGPGTADGSGVAQECLVDVQRLLHAIRLCRIGMDHSSASNERHGGASVPRRQRVRPARRRTTGPPIRLDTRGAKNPEQMAVQTAGGFGLEFKAEEACVLLFTTDALAQGCAVEPGGQPSTAESVVAVLGRIQPRAVSRAFPRWARLASPWHAERRRPGCLGH